MSNRKHTARILVAVAGLSVVGVFGAAPAMAKDGDVIVTGSCSASSTYKLKLGPRDGQLETEFEVDSNVVGQTWNVKMTDNGKRVFKGTAITIAPSGSFEVGPNIPDVAGTDNVVATATNPATGERCVATASV
jgi:hypothetical protein